MEPTKLARTTFYKTASMRQSPINTSWTITCRAPEDVQALTEWLSTRIDLDVFADIVRVIPNGVEKVQTVRHPLGDYFSAIRIMPGNQTNPGSFRLAFDRRPGAGRFWKDLMVNILQEIETAPQKASIDLDSKGGVAVPQIDGQTNAAQTPGRT